MLPIILDIQNQKLALIGSGQAFENRHNMLTQATPQKLLLNPKNLDGVKIIFIAGLSLEESEKQAQRARQVGALVNVEDIPHLCDFHMPAQLRRGDLLFTISTNGRSPALSRILKQDLQKNYGQEWAQRLDYIAGQRAQWRKLGKTPAQISRASQKMVKEQGWVR